MHARKPSKDAARRFTGSKFIWIKDVARDHRVKPLACRVAVLLLDYINATSREAWPTQATLAEHAGVTPRAIRDGLKNLDATGHIVIVRNGYRRSNQYRPALPEWSPKAGKYLPAERTGRSSREEQPVRRLPNKIPYDSSQTPKPLSPEIRAAIGREMRSLAANLGPRNSGGSG